jgi:subtilisin-like proprotein convertase family protein
MKFLSFAQMFGPRRRSDASPRKRAVTSSQPARRARAARLSVEPLEDRTLLSVIPVANVTGHLDISPSLGNHNTPMVAVDRSNPQNLVAVYTRNDPTHLPSNNPVIVEATFSVDGGLSWTPLAMPANLIDPTSSPSNLQPFLQSTNASVGFDRSDNFYIVYSEHKADQSAGAIVLQKFSLSGGVETQLITDNVLYEWIVDSAINPAMAVDDNLPTFTDPTTGAVQNDPFSGNIYVTWSTNDTAPTGATNFNPNSIVLIQSSDGGNSFGSQTIINDNGHIGAEHDASPQLAVSGGSIDGRVSPGQVSVVYDDFNSAATANPPADLIRFKALQAGAAAVIEGPVGPINDATDPGGGLPHITGITNFQTTVDITNANFTTVSDLDVAISLVHATLGQVQIQLIRPGPEPVAQRTITLLNNQIDATGASNTAVGVTGANLGDTASGMPEDTVFDDEAARNIHSNGSVAPFTGHFQSENLQLSAFYGLTRDQINGTWTLVIKDFRADTSPVQFVRDWSLHFTSGLTSPGSELITTSPILGAMTSPYPLKPVVSPERGIGPAPVIASDNTLGSFSPYQGMLYIAYVGRQSLIRTGNPTDNTQIYLITSSDGGVTWSAPVQVNDDSAVQDGFSEADNNPITGHISGRPQFQPSLAVDQSTGTLVVSFYDARQDASRARVARYITASIDGGQTFSAQTFLNTPETAFDEITRKTVTLGAIADNFSSGNAKRDTAFGPGDRQGLAVADGHVVAVWAGNENGGFDGKELTEILAGTATIAVGPRIISSTMGPVSAPLNNTLAADGTRLADTFNVQFDRPVDPGTFTTSAVTVLFSNADPTDSRQISLDVLSVTPLDFGAFGPAGALGATQFQIKFDPTKALTIGGTYIGTYSYSISPVVQDRIRTASEVLVPIQTQTFSADNLNLRIPPVGTGGSGNPSQDITNSQLAVSGIPTGQVITNATVTINLTHTFDSDLVITLTAPNGQQVQLSFRNGLDGHNYTNTTFDDSASISIDLGSAPFTGTFRPDSPLAEFNGGAPNGTWTLSIDDVAALDTGTLLNWSLQLTTGTVSTSTTPGNSMDQDANGTPGEPNTDAYAAPRPLNGIPFQAPYDSDTQPLIVPGPFVASSQVVGNAATPDNLVLNGTVSSIDVTFDRNIDPTTFTPSQVIRVVGPVGTIGPNGMIPASFTITPNPNNTDPDPNNPRTYRINFMSPDGTQPLVLDLNGTYTVVLGSNIKAASGSLMNAPAFLDTNQNAGLDKLRQAAAQTTGVVYSSTDTPQTVGDPAKANFITDSTINVADDFLIQNTTVQVNITYPHDPDLEATLIAPDGTRIELFANVGANGTQANFTNTVFDDNAFPVTPITSGGPPFTGRFNPQVGKGSDLSALNNTSSKGAWTLEIKDDVAGTTGTLQNWSLTLFKAIPPNGLGEQIADQGLVSFRIFTMDPANKLSHSTWTSVGPAENGTGGGRIGGISVDPADPSGNTVYVAGAEGGVWKTTNFLTDNPQGPTYVPLTDFGPTFGTNIGGLAVFARNNDTTQSIVFAATGFADGGAFGPGVGFLRSMDGGATWTLLDSTTNVDANGNTLPLNSPSRDHKFVGSNAFKVVVDPRPTPSGDVIVYAALTGSNGGIWRSVDTGKHWQLMRAGQASDVVLDPNSGHINAISNPTGNLDFIYGAFEGDGVYFSPNRGTVWNQLLGGVGDPLIQDGDFFPNNPIPVTAPSSTPNGAHGRIVLVKPDLTSRVLPDGTYVGGNPAADLLYQGWLYAVVMDTTGHMFGIYLTKDFGQNWTKVRVPTLPPFSAGGSNVQAVPTNDNVNNADYDIGGGGNFAQGNYDVSAAIDPTNPNILYVGGTADGQPTGLIRVDVTGLGDPHAFFLRNDANDGGATRINATDAVSLKNWPDLPGFFFDPVFNPFINLIRDPFDPYNASATVFVSNTKAFLNAGTGATWKPFDLGGTDQHRFVTLRDPVTGHARLIIGDDQGIFSAVDDNGTLSTGGLAPGSDPESGGGAANRNGNLGVAQFYYGASQPSSAAAQIAGALFYSGVQDGASDLSAPDVLSTGNIAWGTDGQGDGAGVATDQTGTGTFYQYKWPCCGGNGTDFFQVNEVGRTFGLLQHSNPGLTPDPQWPYLGGVNFSVNPIDGDQIIISSTQGRIFSTADQGRTWVVIGNPTALDSSQSFAMAFGSPQPSDPTGALNDFLYVGTNGGHIFVTFNGGGTNGNTWTNLSSGLDGSAVQAIVTNPTRGSREAYAVTLNGVYHMVDAADPKATWVNITGNLFQIIGNVLTPFQDSTQFTAPHLGPLTSGVTVQGFLTSVQADWRYAIPDNSFELNNPATPPGPTHPVLYVGGDSGVFRSVDGGKTWTIFPDVAHDGAKQDGGFLPNVNVTSLSLALGNINPTTGHPVVLDPVTGAKGPDVLMASTFGRGSFAIRVAPVIVDGSLQLDPNLPAPKGSNVGPLPGTISVITPVLDGMSEQSAFSNTVKIELFDVTNGLANPINIGVGVDANGNIITDSSGNAVPYAFTDSTGRFRIEVGPGYFKADGSTDGPKVLAVRATDAAGTVGPLMLFNFTLNTTPIIIASSIHLDANAPLPANQGGSDSGLALPTPGAFNTFLDSFTNVTQPIIDGTVNQAAPTTVNIYDATNPSNLILIGSGMTDANGNFSIQVNAGIYKSDGSTDGIKTLQLVAPHIPTPSTTVVFKFELETTPPATPPAPQLTPSSDSGTSNSDHITNVTTPTFFGTGEPNAQVQLYANNVLVGTDLVDSLGNYTVQVTSPLAAGTYDITIRLSDLAGNLSGFSAAMAPQLQIVTGKGGGGGGLPGEILVAPTLQVDPAFITGNLANNITAANPIRILGTTDANTTNQVFDNGVLIDTFAQGSGTSYSRMETLNLGSNTLTVTAIDIAGNTITSAPLTVIVDPSALDPDHKFIRQLYFNALGRTGTLAEWNLWTPLLAQPNGRALVVNGIERSGEARDHLVKGWYQSFLGRQALNGEETPWVNAFLAGATEEQVLSGILGSGEYFNRTPAITNTIGGPSNTTFIQALYIQLLNRSPSPGEINIWASQIPTIGNQGVAFAILSSLEYREDVVRGYYVNLLLRPTAPAQSEVDGWAMSPLDITSIRVGFETSQEFYFRVTGFLP